MKKFLSIVLVFVLMFTLIPQTALAEVNQTIGYYGQNLPSGPDMGGDIVNVTAENAQYTLDGAYGSIDGKTINFTESITEILEIARPTKYAGSNTTYYSAGFGSVIASPADAQGVPCYSRALSNVKFTSSNDVTLKGFYIAVACDYNGKAYDYVCDEDVTSGDISNIANVISGLTFEGLSMNNTTGKCIDFRGGPCDANPGALGTLSGVTFKNCSFTSVAAEMPAIEYYNEDANGKVSNLTVDGCTFTNCYQGVYTHHIKGITVKDCTFTTTGHNAIAVQGGGTVVNHGAVTITGNSFSGVGDRVIRFNAVGADTQITITGNTVTDGGLTTEESMKASSLADGITYNIHDNNWSGFKAAYNQELRDVNMAAQIGTSKYVTLAAAITAAQNGDTIQLLSDTTENVTIPEEKVITLDLNDKVLSGGGTGAGQTDNVAKPVIINNGTLTIKDSAPTTQRHFAVDVTTKLWTLNGEGTKTVTGGIITGGYKGYSHGGGSGIHNTGTLTLQSGTIVGNYGHSCFEKGGGVYNDTNAVFTMNGGRIVGNACYFVDTNKNPTGTGGGVYTKGTFTMSGGTIDNNYAPQKGGDVLVSGSFQLSGGTIRDSAAKVNSVGVYGTMTMNSGTITDCYQAVGVYGGGTFSLKGGTIENCGDFEQYCGSGISASASSGDGTATVNVSGGTIQNCKARMGAAVGIEGKSAFTMTGGTFMGNTAKTQGGAIYVTNNDVSPVVTIQNGSFTGNTAPIGGVIWGQSGYTIEGGIFTGNTATGTDIGSYKNGGGAVFFNGESASQTLTITGGIFSNNTVDAAVGKGKDVFVRTNYQANATISGGTFSGGVYINGSNSLTSVTVSDGRFGAFEVGTGSGITPVNAGFISGGLFASAPDSAYLLSSVGILANTAAATKVAYPCKVGVATVSMGGKQYATLTDALTVYQSETVTLLADADATSVTDSFIVSKNDHTLTLGQGMVAAKIGEDLYIVGANASSVSDQLVAGEFSIDPSSYVAQGYKASKVGKLWYVGKEKTADVSTNHSQQEETVPYIVSADTAVISTEKDADISNMSTLNTPVVLDVTKTETENVWLARSTVEAVETAKQEATGSQDALTIMTKETETARGDATVAVTFNKNAVKHIVEASTEGVKLSVNTFVDTTKVAVENAQAMTGLKASKDADESKIVVLQLTLVNENDEAILSREALADKEDTKITIRVKAPDGCNRASLYYLNGNTAELLGDTSVDSDGYGTFEMSHFSEYALVGYTAVESDSNGGGSGYSGQVIISELNNISKVSVDGKVVDSKYYMVSGGVVVFSDSYLKTLSNGNHTVKLENAVRSAQATITVNNNAIQKTVIQTTSAKTGDQGIALYIGLMAGAVLAAGVAIWMKKRKK